MAEENKFKVEIITPDRVFFTGEADMIEFNTGDGQIGVYKNHIPLTTVLEPGVVVIHNDDQQKVAAVHAGFAEILGEKVTLLAELAEWPDEIDINRAEAAKQRAEDRIAAKLFGVVIGVAECALQMSLTRIDVAGHK